MRNASFDHPPSRRAFLRRTLQAGGLGLPFASWLAAPLPVRAQSSSVPEMTAETLMTRETHEAVDAGLRYLAGRQVDRGADKGAFGNGGYQGSVGICGLAGLAFLSEGSTPDVGRFGKSVDGCCDFVLRHVSPSGYIARTENAVGNMYGHGFALLFLTQVYGMTRRKDLADKLRTAVKLTISAQNAEGGWRYQPRPVDADLSVSVCQVMALRAARDAGITVPDAVRDKCIEYVKKSQNDDGGFRYTLNGGHTTFALTAAGLVSLFSAGIYDGPHIEKGLKYLTRNRMRAEGHYFFYGHYYAVQAMWHAGGEWWNDWYPRVRDMLLKRQQSNGSWTSPYSNEFGTAMACIILQMPNDRLPIFAR